MQGDEYAQIKKRQTTVDEQLFPIPVHLVVPFRLLRMRAIDPIRWLPLSMIWFQNKAFGMRQIVRRMR
jgi:hypothetical protein